MITRNPGTGHSRGRRSQRSRTVAALAALGAVLTLVTTACSSDSGGTTSSDQPAKSTSTGASEQSSSDTSTPAPPPAQGITDTTIKIGVLGPFSGNASVYSKATDLAMAIYKDVNANGGINGRQIEIVSADTKCDAATLQGIIRKFVEQDKVFMISGGSCSNAIIAAKPLIEQYGIPMVTMNAASAKISDPPLPNLFHVKATSEEQADAIAKFVASNPDAHTVAFAATSDEWGQSGIAPVQTALEADPDITIATNQQLDPEGADPTPAIRKMIDTHPDMAVVFAYPQPMTTFLKNARPQGLTVPVVTGDGTRPDEQAARLGSRKSAENFFSVFGFSAPFDDPSHDKYKELFTQEYPNLDWDTVALEGAVSAEFNVAVLKAMAETMTWENFIKTAETITVDSVAGTLQFAPYDANDKLTRRPGIKPNFSVLDPHDSGDKTIVVTDWADWLKAKG